jgi:hypothetical protein
MLMAALVGTLIAGFYGMIHDQITYSISPEYFTRFKFQQFAWANFGLPPRAFASLIGFLATWWVGFFAAWFLARIALPKWPAPEAHRHISIGLATVMICGITGASVGHFLALIHTADYSNWTGAVRKLGVHDVPAFVHVAYIHNAGYLGGLAGLVAALLHLRGKGQNPASLKVPNRIDFDRPFL